MKMARCATCETLGTGRHVVGHSVGAAVGVKGVVHVVPRAGSFVLIICMLRELLLGVNDLHQLIRR